MQRSLWLQATVRVAVIWGVSWGAVNVAIALAERFGHLLASGLFATPLVGPAFSAFLSGLVVGAVCGALFSFYLRIAARNSSLDELTTGRVAFVGLLAACGVGAGLVALRGLPLGAGVSTVLIEVGTFGGLGLVSAISTLSVARRASISAPTEAVRLPAT